MADKKANYTQAMVDQMHKEYDPSASEAEREAVVESLAEEFGKTTKSVRAKLVREGLYVAKAYKTKKGEKPETKEAIVSEIAALLGVDADSSLAGLEKATKNCLILIRGTFRAIDAEASGGES